MLAITCLCVWRHIAVCHSTCSCVFGITWTSPTTCLNMVNSTSHGYVSAITWLDAAGELLDTLPPGIDEAVAISKVVQFLKSPEYSHFQHIVFDTAPTGHTLRLLTLPDFLDKTIGRDQFQDACSSNFFSSPHPPPPSRLSPLPPPPHHVMHKIASACSLCPLLWLWSHQSCTGKQKKRDLGT